MGFCGSAVVYFCLTELDKLGLGIVNCSVIYDHVHMQVNLY